MKTWTEISIPKRRWAALYDPQYIRLSERVARLSEQIRLTDAKGIDFSLRTIKLSQTAEEAFEKLIAYIKDYVVHAKKHRHRAFIILHPNIRPHNISRYCKDGKIIKAIDLKMRNLAIEYAWALDCRKKLKKRLRLR